MSDYPYYWPPPPQPPQSEESTALEEMDGLDEVYQEDNLICDYCGDVIDNEHPAIHLYLGKAGRGPKSGQPMVVEDKYVEYPSQNVHRLCIVDIAKAIAEEDGQELEEIFCAGCEAKIGGD